MNGLLYRYVLTVIDVFSSFLWFRPLESKSKRVIASELEYIYMEHRSPGIIHDQESLENTLRSHE